jgi:hypothetical protein
MKASRATVIFLLCLVAFGLAGWAWNQYCQLIALRAAQSSLASPADEARLLAAAQSRIESYRKRLAAQQAARADREKAKPSAATRNNWTSTPEAQQLLGSMRNYRLSLMIDQSYGALFKKMNLSPEQLAQFKDLIADKKQAVIDAIAAAREQGLQSNPALFKEALLQASGSLDSQIQQAIGTEAFAQFQQYESTLPERNSVNLVIQDLSKSTSPLSADQVEGLVQILAADHPATSAVNIGALLGSGTVRISNTDIQAASAELSPPQLQAVQQVQQQQQAQQRMNQILYQQQHPSAPGGG